MEWESVEYTSITSSFFQGETSSSAGTECGRAGHWMYCSFRSSILFKHWDHRHFETKNEIKYRLTSIRALSFAKQLLPLWTMIRKKRWVNASNRWNIKFIRKLCNLLHPEEFVLTRMGKSKTYLARLFRLFHLHGWSTSNIIALDQFYRIYQTLRLHFYWI